jgi:drug/metabolite transporter (DMT)-like permease
MSHGASTTRMAIIALVNYSFCSGGMLVFNKLAVHHLPYPSLVATIQFTVCAVVVNLCKRLGWLDVDDLEASKVKPFMLYNVVFVLGIYANMRALGGSNVDTIIVFRTCVPLVIALLDWAFMGRALPNLRSFLALLLILAGAAGYVAVDSAFKMQGWAAYGWCLAWVCTLCFLMVFGKQITDTLGMRTMWGHVYYSNALSVGPMLALGLVTGEAAEWSSVEFTDLSVAFLVLSTVAGAGLSYTGWQCRDLFSATTYTLIGVMCKVITVFINVIMWDRHATATGIGFLLLCLLGGTLYQPAPLRRDAEAAAKVEKVDDPESDSSPSAVESNHHHHHQSPAAPPVDCFKVKSTV